MRFVDHYFIILLFYYYGKRWTYNNARGDVGKRPFKLENDHRRGHFFVLFPAPARLQYIQITKNRFDGNFIPFTKDNNYIRIVTCVSYHAVPAVTQLYNDI